jgi:hypothetical protein
LSARVVRIDRPPSLPGLRAALPAGPAAAAPAAPGSGGTPPLFSMNTSRSAFGKGSGRNSSAFTRLKIAVLAPMPMARIRMAMSEKAASRRSVRKV